MNAAVEMRWEEELKDMEECEALAAVINKSIIVLFFLSICYSFIKQQAIQHQIAEFKKITHAKDRLIDSFKKELDKKELEYITMIKDQAQEIDDMISKMRLAEKTTRKHSVLII
jgi:hypothetical protein